MKKYLIFFILPLVMGCSSVKIAYDYDRQVDFTQFKTYNFTDDDLNTSVGELNADRIRAAAKKEIELKGFISSETPDVLVNLYLKSKQKVDATATTMGGPYGGYGYGRYGYGGGYSTTQVSYNEYTEGTLFISLVDSKTEKIVWQGTGTKTLSETSNAQKNENNINYAVQQILSKYPPAIKE